MATKKTGGVKAPREVEKKTPEQVVEKEAAERPQYKVPFITARIDRLSDNPDSKIRANDDEEIKVDVAWQIMNNWDVFVDYTWNNRKKL